VSISVQGGGQAVTGVTLEAGYSGTENVSFQWNRNGLPLTGQTGTTLLANTVGSYTVTASLTGFLSRTSSPIFVIDPSGTQISFVVHIPTLEQEASFGVFYIQELNWFINVYGANYRDLLPQHIQNTLPVNYNDLPSGALRDAILAVRAVPTSSFVPLQGSVASNLRNLFMDYYANFNYTTSKNLMESAANEAVQQIQSHTADFLSNNRPWFFVPPNGVYNIYLTLFGPGGTYNWANGDINIKVSDNAQLTHTRNVIIHEVIHIGIENSVIRSNNIHQMSNGQLVKETIVDEFTLAFFGFRLNSEHFRDMPTVNFLVQTPNVFNNLPANMGNFLATNPWQTPQTLLEQAESLASSLATNQTPTDLEGIWIHNVNPNLIYIFRGNGFVQLHNNTFNREGTFSYSGEAITFTRRTGGSWTQPYTLNTANGTLNLTQVPGENFGTFTRLP
jgi:hypothetical protein